MSAQSDFITSAIKNSVGHTNKGTPTYWNFDTANLPSSSTAYSHVVRTPYGVMTFIPESFVTSGANSDGKTWVSTYFQDQNNLNNFAKDATYVDLSGSGIKGMETKGYVVPGVRPDISSSLFSFTDSQTGGGITGIAKLPNGQIGYATQNGGYVSVPAAGTSSPSGYIDTGFGIIPAGYNTYDGKTPSIYTPAKQEQSNNFFDKLGQNMGPIIKLAALVSGDPSLLAFSAAKDVMDGNWLGAATSIAGLVGEVPGVDAETAATAKNVSNGLQIANAIKTNNPIAALTALAGMSGTGLPSEVTKAAQLIAVNNAIQKGDMAALAVAVGNIADNKDLSYAGKAANVVNAIKTGDVSKITASLYGFIPELQAGYKAGDVSAIFDKMGYSLGANETQLLESGLNTAPEALVQQATGVAPTSVTTTSTDSKASQTESDPVLAAVQAQQQAENDAILAKYLKSLETPAQPTEQTTTQPTEPTKAPERPLQNVFDAYVRAYGLDQGAGLFQQMYGDVRPYLQANDTAAPADDGTTAGIQDIINPPTAQEPTTSQPDTGLPMDDGTTAGIEDIINPPADTSGGSLGDESDLPPADQGGSLGDESDLPPVTEEEPQCAPGYHWDGSMCVSDEDVTDTSTTCPEGYIFDLGTQSCVPIGTTTGGAGGAGGGTKPGGTTPKTPTTPTTPKTPTTPTTPPTGAQPGSQQMDLSALLALLGAAGGGQQTAPTPPPTVDIGPQLDLEAPLEVNPFARTQTQPKMASGGSIDDLLAMLQQRG